MSIVAINNTNMKEWAEMSAQLFPELSFEEAYTECEQWLTTKKEVGVLYQKDNQYIGFMNLSVRNDYVNGTDTSPVVFVEAIYIKPNYRKQGIGREFIKYAENFARQRGITQLASDCFTDNTQSEHFHISCGFIEKERVICFVKDIGSEE